MAVSKTKIASMLCAEVKGTETETKIYQNCIERKSCIEEVERKRRRGRGSRDGYFIDALEWAVPSSLANMMARFPHGSEYTYQIGNILQQSHTSFLPSQLPIYRPVHTLLLLYFNT